MSSDWPIGVLIVAGEAVAGAGILAVTVAVALVYVFKRTARKSGSSGGLVEAFAAARNLSLVEKSEGLLVHEGTVDGVQIKLRAGENAAIPDDRKRANAKATFVSVAASCKRPLVKGLQLWTESSADMQRKTSRKLNEVEVGDSALDQGLIIRGASPGQIKVFLSTPEVRDAVLEFFTKWPQSIVSDHWVKCEQDRAQDDAGLDAMLRAAIALAAILDKNAR